MRFCTSPSGVTTISRMRFSDRRRNSMCLKVITRRGVITTPANCVSCDSRLDAVWITRCGLSGSSWLLDLVQVLRLQLPDHEQGVDEEAVAGGRRHAPGGGVRAGDEAELLEIGHHVADGGGRKIEPGVARQGARADRLAFGNVALDQRLEQDLGALVQHGNHCTLGACRSVALR
jgi:hypothetical protein